MERLIIDTDPGVDDAQALLSACGHPETKVEAIMVVSGNVGLDRTVANACTIVDQVGQDIPVYAGCATALVFQAENAAFVHGEDGLGDVGFAPSERNVEAEHAAVGLVRLANASPGELTMIAIGPLTNIAVALRLDPTLPRKLKRFLIMGGAVTSHGNTKNVSAEFNIFADPEAAHVVFEGWHENEQIIDVIDWEATMAHGIPTTVFERWLTMDTPRARFYKAISAKTIEFVRTVLGRDEMLAADALAMSVALEPDIVKRAEEHFVFIETSGRHTRGQTTVDWHDRSGFSPNANIILEIDINRFYTLLEQGLR